MLRKGSLVCLLNSHINRCYDFDFSFFQDLVMGFGLSSTIATGNAWSDRALKASLDSESSAQKYLRWFVSVISFFITNHVNEFIPFLIQSLAFSQGLLVAPLYVLSPALASRGFVLTLSSLCTTSYAVATLG
jgi:hypothetical protein